MKLKKIKTNISAVWSATLYYAQGLPFSIVRQMSVVYFKDQGVSLKNLGLVALYGIPWTFKFLWSPLVDTFSTKRNWIISMELILAASLGLLTTSVSMNSSAQVAAVIFLLIAVFSATHDIAVDGFYLETLDKNDQAKYSGWIVASYRLALLTGSGFLISVSGQWGWGAAFGAACALFILLSFWHFTVLPSKVKKLSDDNKKHDFNQMVKGFKSFLLLPRIYQAIAFIILFKLGDALLFGMSTPFLLDAGLSKSQLGFFVGIVGVICAISASIGGGLFISRYRLRRGLWVFGIVQNFAIPVYALVAWIKPDTKNGGLWMLVAAIVIEQIAAGLGTAAYSNFLMRQNNPDYKATHYAIATGLMSFTTMLGGVLSGFGAFHFGYPTFFTLAFVGSLPGLFLIPFVARRPECQ